ncbi:MAG: PIN domain-containing protein [Treponemataceae bacterium]|nr:PIN domain-containing protein [Treponemataceae bacterium]
MVLVDTSAWIGYFNDVPPVADMVETVIRNGKVVLCPIVWTEILQGVRDDRVLEEMRLFLSDFVMLDDDSMSVAEKTVSLYRSLRKKGVTIRKTNDCMIASYALLNDVPILQIDRDFSLIAENSPLELYLPGD